MSRPFEYLTDLCRVAHRQPEMDTETTRGNGFDHKARHVLYVLCDHAGSHGSGWLTNRQLSQETALSERSVRRALDDLRGAGVVETVLASDRKRWDYSLRLPDRATGPATVTALVRPQRPHESGHRDRTVRPQRPDSPANVAAGSGPGGLACETGAPKGAPAGHPQPLGEGRPTLPVKPDGARRRDQDQYTAQLDAYVAWLRNRLGHLGDTEATHYVRQAFEALLAGGVTFDRPEFDELVVRLVRRATHQPTATTSEPSPATTDAARSVA